MPPQAFQPVLRRVLSGLTEAGRLLERTADGLSGMDKKAAVQKDKKGGILYDQETKDAAAVRAGGRMEDSMACEGLTRLLDAQRF